jgi:hypothetical protein
LKPRSYTDMLLEQYGEIALIRQRCEALIAGIYIWPTGLAQSESDPAIIMEALPVPDRALPHTG